ncbi:hypothetical protein D3C71_1987820 [compost metagenome]
MFLLFLLITNQASELINALSFPLSDAGNGMNPMSSDFTFVPDVLKICGMTQFPKYIIAAFPSASSFLDSSQWFV